MLISYAFFPNFTPKQVMQPNKTYWILKNSFVENSLFCAPKHTAHAHTSRSQKTTLLQRFSWSHLLTTLYLSDSPPPPSPRLNTVSATLEITKKYVHIKILAYKMYYPLVKHCHATIEITKESPHKNIG